jgi:tRNA pseudouridine55 synthase
MQITIKTYQNLIPVYKPVGKTPLECVEEYKSKHLIDSTTKVSYAGRLDPMAEGVLLLLVGDANKKRREYEHLSKEYEVKVLVGFATDTGDLMGKLIMNDDQLQITNVKKQLRVVISSFTGSVEQKYPIYSSAKVQGKPLYWWARQGRLNEIVIPNHKVNIESTELLSEDDSMSSEVLLKYIFESVKCVQGDFRQDEIIAKWQESLKANDNSTNHPIFTLRITCGSGTYMRQLVADIGEKLNIPLVAFKIKRIKVGKYRLADCVA